MALKNWFVLPFHPTITNRGRHRKIAQQAKIQPTEAKAELKRQKDMYSKYQTFQVEDPETYKKHHTGKLEFHQAQINAVNATITASQKELDDLRQALPTREEFVELVHSYLKTILETSDLIEEDAVYREVVSNLRARDNSISVIKLNPPYDLMVDLSENTSWSTNDDTNQTSEILDSLYGVLMNYDLLNRKVGKLKLLLENVVKPESLATTSFLM